MYIDGGFGQASNRYCLGRENNPLREQDCHLVRYVFLLLHSPSRCSYGLSVTSSGTTWLAWIYYKWNAFIVSISGKRLEMAFAFHSKKMVTCGCKFTRDVLYSCTLTIWIENLGEALAMLCTKCIPERKSRFEFLPYPCIPPVSAW